MENITAHLLGVGTAVPESLLTQRDAAAHAASVRAATPAPEGDRAGRTRGVEALYRRAGIETRGSVLHGGRNGLDAFFPADPARIPSTAARLSHYRAHAGGLATRAASAAVENAAIDPGAITHLITVSCTGFDTPGVDHQIMADLQLSPSVRRTHIGFMGCHAAINALAAAAAFAREDPANLVLVCCVELCSLHFSYDRDPERCVANALFADGAAAAVVSGAPSGSSDSPRLSGFSATVLPDSADLMSWSIGDEGFSMRLSPRVPDRLAGAVPGWIGEFLSRHGLTTEGVRSWAIHPGGPRVLSAVRGALGLEAQAEEDSRAVLATHGNMSSATVLFIIDRMLRSNPERATPILAVAFGPGLSGEAMLLT
jgi:predicted naringenin-chalcone synthase